MAEEAAGHLANGFRRMKMRLGRSEEYDTEAVRAVRRAIGPDNDLMADASMKYHVALARRIGKCLEENKAFWFEEPFQPEDIDSYAALRGTRRRADRGRRERVRRAGVPRVDPRRRGGHRAARRQPLRRHQRGVADREARGGGRAWRLRPHTWSDAVAVIANAHVVAAMPNGLTVEMDQTGNPMIDDLLVEPLQVRDGSLRLGERPGLGIELNQAVVERLRMADPLAIPDGFYSDMVFGTEGLGPSAPYQEKA